MRLTESLHELRETNNSLLTTKQNEAMKALTVMALFTFPLTLVAAMFAIETPSTPIVHLEHGFWIILGIMGIIALAMFVTFKHRKWL